MFAEVTGGRLCSGILKPRPKELFGGTGFSGELRERKKKWLGKTPGSNSEDGDGLIGTGSLKNDGVQILNAARKFGLSAQGFVDLVEFFVKRASAFEVEFLTRFFALGFVGRTQGVAAGFQELNKFLHFHVVFFLRAAGKARRKAHFHFGVDATWKRRIAANFDLAATDFEEVEDSFGKGFG